MGQGIKLAGFGLLLMCLGLLCLVSLSVADPQASPQKLAIVLDVKGPIGPAIGDYVHRGLEKAREKEASLIILKMDTPGGLDTSMRDIIRDLLASPIPVVTYVAPSGARAASAGAFILVASHAAAMAPGTNIGAATPIRMGGLPMPTQQKEPEKKEDKGKAAKAPKGKPELGDKVLNDAVSYMRSLAQLQKRNVKSAEKFVLEAKSISAEEALKEGIIEFIATDTDSLLKKLDGHRVTIMNVEVPLDTQNMKVETIEQDWRTELLGIITSPYVAYILLLAGIYGLMIEFTHPGAFVPGVIGGICLLIAFFALHILPVNYAGLALILLGLAFMISEALMPSFGVLGFGGVVAFVIGSIMLMDTDIPGYGVSWTLVGSIATLSSSFLALIVVLAFKARRRPVVAGGEQLIGMDARVMDWHGNQGHVQVMGELWNAYAKKPLKPSDAIRVVKREGLTLFVEPSERKRED
ncbi:MAG: nodulation protein NfeD [Alphaproteobacteria bacterium]|jgi:membrane-bound serine protease (ClpP class)|nr:nodulation protein NfeD [Alphaproteobacteria bacterium]MBT5390383.1 nodulation protein NfeD [Alphaproteobacteria bacterium]MBT5540110.1 nodulation protein NfeD [Alphaproteobacteria bacterium]MBT5653894.1 nodulation protein NfeD [Alphaproteobacteria bacterium]